MKLKFLSMALIAMMAVSCGGNKENENSASEEESTEINDTTSSDNSYSLSNDSYSAMSESSTEETEESNSTSGADIDAWLDKYENLMDTYISLAKKAQAGDMSAAEEYAKYAAELAELYSELENVSSEMTPAQTSRLARIYAKMASAAY